MASASFASLCSNPIVVFTMRHRERSQKIIVSLSRLVCRRGGADGETAEEEPSYWFGMFLAVADIKRNQVWEVRDERVVLSNAVATHNTTILLLSPSR